MTKDEFIHLCYICGYASRKNAKEYAQGREVFTGRDFEEVFFVNELRKDLDPQFLEWLYDDY